MYLLTFIVSVPSAWYVSPTSTCLSKEAGVSFSSFKSQFKCDLYDACNRVGYYLDRNFFAIAVSVALTIQLLE